MEIPVGIKGRNKSMRCPGLDGERICQDNYELKKGKGQAVRMRGLSRLLLKL
jgi:hypothetical protein